MGARRVGRRASLLPVPSLARARLSARFVPRICFLIRSEKGRGGFLYVPYGGGQVVCVAGKVLPPNSPKPRRPFAKARQSKARKRHINKHPGGFCARALARSPVLSLCVSWLSALSSLFYTFLFRWPGSLGLSRCDFPNPPKHTRKKQQRDARAAAKMQRTVQRRVLSVCSYARTGQSEKRGGVRGAWEWW